MKPLYIGLRGLAGSGKDTVGNFLSYCLDNYDKSYNQIVEEYLSLSREVMKSSLKTVFSIALADPLKTICADIFGIPLEPFYSGNKNSAWVSLEDFKYTETQPDESLIITADEYYSGVRKKHAYMSIREIMVYVGTYILQKDINKNIFVNLTENTIQRKINANKNLSYVIVTDIRFEHEYNYIRENSGIMINITNNRTVKLDNIAENSLDDCNNYDYTINNDGTYDDLFRAVYDLIHSDESDVFVNSVIELETRSLDTNTYLRMYSNDVDETIYRLCTKNKLQRLNKEFGQIILIDPAGGPTIKVGEEIPGTDIIPTQIIMDDDMVFWIHA